MPARFTKVNISLSKSMRGYVAERVQEEGFADASEYFRHLVRQDRERRGAELGALIAEGLASGPTIEMTASRRAAMRERLVRKHKGRKTSA
jgi:antitoxin ParD1/3/4